MNDGNSLKVLLPENELNAAPLGDVDGQSDVNEALVQRLMGHWRDSLSPATLLDLKTALMCEQHARANYQRTNRFYIKKEGFKNKKLEQSFILASNGLADCNQMIQLFRNSKAIHTMDIASYTHGDIGRKDLLETLFPEVARSYLQVYGRKGYAVCDDSFERDDKHRGLISKYDCTNKGDYIRKTCSTIHYARFYESKSGRALMGRYFDLKLVFDSDGDNKQLAEEKIIKLIDKGLFSYYKSDEIGRDFTFHLAIATNFFIANLDRNERLRSYFPKPEVFSSRY